MLSENAREGKKVPVMGNIGTISTADTIAFGNKAKETGIDCALVIVPFYVKPNQEGMYQHFTAVAKGVDLPLVLYNVPGRTGVSIQPETIKRIVDECPNVVGIKDATGKLGSGHQGKSASSGRLHDLQR